MKRTIVGMVAAAAASVSLASPSQASCHAYGYDIPANRTVCYSRSMRQYGCYGRPGQYYFRYIQRITLPSALRSRSSCWYTDRTNTRPDGPPYGTEVR